MNKRKNLRNVARKKIDEIIRLKTELKNEEELKYIEDHENGKLLSDPGHDKKVILSEMNFKEIKQKKTSDIWNKNRCNLLLKK